MESRNKFVNFKYTSPHLAKIRKKYLKNYKQKKGKGRKHRENFKKYVSFWAESGIANNYADRIYDRAVNKFYLQKIRIEKNIIH